MRNPATPRNRRQRAPKNEKKNLQRQNVLRERKVQSRQQTRDRQLEREFKLDHCGEHLVSCGCSECHFNNPLPKLTDQLEQDNELVFEGRRRFQICVHGKVPNHCRTCQILTLLLWRLKTRKAGLLTLPVDIYKIIFAHLPDVQAACNRCLNSFKVHKVQIDGLYAVDGLLEVDDYECNMRTYCSGMGNSVEISGCYGSIIDDEWLEFCDEEKRPLNRVDFMTRYFTRKQRSMEIPIRKLRFCNRCITSMRNNNELQESNRW